MLALREEVSQLEEMEKPVHSKNEVRVREVDEVTEAQERMNLDNHLFFFFFLFFDC